MKIIFIANSPPDSYKASGYQTFCQSQSLGEILDLKLFLPNRFYKNKKNHEVSILKSLDAFKKLTFKTKLINFFNITDKLWINHHLRFFISNFSFAFFSFLKIFNEDCDLIYTRDFYTLFILSIAKGLKIINKKIAYESHQFSLIRFFLIKNIDYLITINMAQKKLYKHKNSLVLHDCVWEKDILKTLPSSISKKTILYAGSCIKSKGINRLIYLADKMPDYNFYIATNEGFNNNNVIKSLYRNNTNWVGKLSKRELFKLIDKVEFCILPNDPCNRDNIYTSPMKLFEYMSRGKALILSPISTVSEIFPKNTYVNLGKSNKDLDMACEVIRNINSTKISEYSLKLITEFTWEKRAQKIYKLFIQ